jgi:hypothetical protein
MLKLADTTLAARQVKAEQTHIRSLYVGGHVDDLQATNQLVAIGVATDAAQHLVATWKRERNRASKQLTQAQIIHAVTHDAMTAQQALTALQADGLSKADATIVLTSHGVKVA